MSWPSLVGARGASNDSFVVYLEFMLKMIKHVNNVSF